MSNPPQNPLAGMNPAALMAQSQQALASPMAQATPQGGGQIDPTQHPVVAALIKALSSGASAYGWTAMQPAERLERQQMEQKKAETLAGLASTQALREADIGIRGQLAETSEERAQTYAKQQESEAQNRRFNQQLNERKLSLAQEQNEWKKDIAQGNLANAHARLDQRAAQFEQTFQLRAKQVGIEQAKLELGEEANQIRAGMVDVARQSLAQRGTMEGAQLQEKVTSWDREHYILSGFFGGLGDLKDLFGAATAAPTPGVAPIQPQPQPTPSGVPAVGGKAGAKAQQRGGRTPPRPAGVPADATWDGQYWVK